MTDEDNRFKKNKFEDFYLKYENNEIYKVYVIICKICNFRFEDKELIYARLKFIRHYVKEHEQFGV